MDNVTTTQEIRFNAREIDEKYKDIWQRGIHLFTVDDRNRDFYYSIFFVDLLYVEVIYNKIAGNIITIKMFTNKDKYLLYMTVDFF